MGRLNLNKPLRPVDCYNYVIPAYRQAGVSWQIFG